MLTGWSEDQLLARYTFYSHSTSHLLTRYLSSTPNPDQLQLQDWACTTRMLSAELTWKQPGNENMYLKALKKHIIVASYVTNSFLHLSFIFHPSSINQHVTSDSYRRICQECMNLSGNDEDTKKGDFAILMHRNWSNHVHWCSAVRDAHFQCKFLKFNFA